MREGMREGGKEGGEGREGGRKKGRRKGSREEREGGEGEWRIFNYQWVRNGNVECHNTKLMLQLKTIIWKAPL